MKKKQVILAILDGWGITKASKGNVITLAKTPTYDCLLKHYPNTKLVASGAKVGLPSTQDGNSEAGHMNIGAGRVIKQDDMYITSAIKNGTFLKNPAFLEAIHHAKENKSSIHLIGLLTGIQSAHVNPEHLNQLLGLLKKEKVEKVYLHLFSDGRDAPKYESVNYLKKLKSKFRNGEKIASISGRFFAMDRNKKWVNSEKAYKAMVNGKGREAKSAEEAITQAYNSGESDEFITPTVIVNNKKPVGKIEDNDAIIFFNLRSDRARQLTKLFVQKNICDRNKTCRINRNKLKNIKFVSMSDFGPDLDDILTAFPSRDLLETLPMQLKEYRQLYMAESEKYAHVTYFFNGGYKDPVAGEAREMIPSPDVDSYDQKPEMSSHKIVRKLKSYIKNDKYDFYVVNFASPDMVAHTGNLEAGIKAVEDVDRCLKELCEVVKKKRNMSMIITSDHGNVEEMIKLETGEIDTKHSSNPVPFILVDSQLKNKKLRQGILGDIAPTILDIMGITKPKLMSGKSLLKNR
jgi:2,3-bisphosphoglycerate-independent phosphoglycerate mutase